MKKHILITSLIAAFAMPVLAQIPGGGAIPKDSSQIRDDNHDFRPDRVDQRSDDKDLNSNEARDAKRAKIKEMKKQKKYEKEHPGEVQQPGSTAP